MTTVRVRWAAGARGVNPPTPQYITHNVLLLGACGGIAPGNQPDLLLPWQPTDTYTHTQNCSQFMATRDEATQSYTITAEVVRLIVGRGVSGRYPKIGHDPCTTANCTVLQGVHKVPILLHNAQVSFLASNIGFIIQGKCHPITCHEGTVRTDV
jgi:hypothetical protein